ncbi:MAG: type III-B CRISPR module-associated protein Cmr5 [Planctomycetota bacterium]
MITEGAKVAATLGQRRARHAWAAVERMERDHVKSGKPDEKAKEFGGQAKRMPARILAAGLGQALTFLLAKDYAPDLLIELADWILDKRSNPESRKEKPAKDALIKAIINGSSDFLRQATDEAMAYLPWLSRFAEAKGFLAATEGA